MCIAKGFVLTSTVSVFINLNNGLLWICYNALSDCFNLGANLNVRKRIKVKNDDCFMILGFGSLLEKNVLKFNSL